MLRRIARMATSSLAQPVDCVGASGLTYRFDKLIQQRVPLGNVWIAEARTKQYLLKDVPESYVQNFNEDIRPRLSAHPHLRLPIDTISNQNIFVYDYLSHDFLALAREKLPDRTRKTILQAVLDGLSALHDKDIVHLDVKPDNVVVECRYENEEAVIEKVQIADFENSIWLPPPKSVRGALAGNENWRSPEAHLRAKLNKPTDMFSFGVMCIYAMMGRIIFGPDEDLVFQESQGNIAPIVRLQRQVSYFGDERGFEGFLRHIGPGDINEVLQAMWDFRNDPEIPYKHFSTWPDVTDADFRDLILKLTNLDPGARITAQEALQHPWFTEVRCERLQSRTESTESQLDRVHVPEMPAQL